jgi:hypothetical protein
MLIYIPGIMMLRHYLIMVEHFGRLGIEKWNPCFLIHNLQMVVGPKRVGAKLRAREDRMRRFTARHFVP